MTNNEVEYEAVIAGLQLVKALQARVVVIFFDSKLVADQVNSKWLTKNERMVAYKQLVREIMEEFQELTVYESIIKRPISWRLRHQF